MNPEEMYELLHARFGPQHWWPGDSPFEIMVGAILTQQTSWSNVERAIANLKAADALSPRRIASMPRERLEELIRPSGFYRQKSGYLGNLCNYLMETCGGDVDALFARPPEELRKELLALKGIGPETADSILLYAGNMLTFVVDAYTVRICRRTGMLDSARYDEVKHFFEESMPPDVQIYQEYHALFVALGKDICRPRKPGCGECPLKAHCQYFREEREAR